MNGGGGGSRGPDEVGANHGDQDAPKLDTKEIADAVLNPLVAVRKTSCV